MRRRRSPVQFRGTKCLNCDQPLELTDKFCPNCGQANSTKKLSFDDFFNEFFAGLFAYDSRLNRTLGTLLFRPGKISRDYVSGKRIRYANPFRFYLSTSIIFFILMSLSSSFEGIDLGTPSEEAAQELSEEQKKELRRLQKLSGGKLLTIDIDTLKTARQEQSEDSYQQAYVTQEGLDSLGLLKKLEKQFTLYNRFYQETDIAKSETALDSLNHPLNTQNQWVYKKAVDWNLLQQNPEVFVNYFVSKLPFIIFFYLPVFALFIWLLYIRKPYNYMEHLIFTFHVQSTFFVFLILGLILDFIFKSSMATGVVVLIFLFYLYKALRRFYEQGWFKTLVKFSILNGIFFILALCAAIFSVIASFAIY